MTLSKDEITNLLLIVVTVWALYPLFNKDWWDK